MVDISIPIEVVIKNEFDIKAPNHKDAPMLYEIRFSKNGKDYSCQLDTEIIPPRKRSWAGYVRAKKVIDGEVCMPIADKRDAEIFFSELENLPGKQKTALAKVLPATLWETNFPGISFNDLLFARRLQTDTRFDSTNAQEFNEYGNFGLTLDSWASWNSIFETAVDDFWGWDNSTNQTDFINFIQLASAFAQSKSMSKLPAVFWWTIL